MFKLHSEYQPTGDQPKAIDYLSKGIQERQEISNTSRSYGFSEKRLLWQILSKMCKNQPLF
jgi:excinuclease UvrABC helicase subunit UvrB